MIPQSRCVVLSRVDRLDALRGLAMVWMAVFHLCFDLNLHGLWSPPQNFRLDSFWSFQRLAIVSLFLFCAGLGQALAHVAGQSPHQFFRRWAQVVACAAVVSATSWWMFPRSWIYFGVLHGMAVMLCLLWALNTALRLGVARAPDGAARWAPAGLAMLGVLALSAPRWAADPFFNHPAWDWTGLVTRLPITEDYVPVLPWFGVMLWGCALGLSVLSWGRWLTQPLPAPLKPLAVLGRWPLSFYMLHQPVWLGLIGLGLWWRGGAP